MSTNIRASTEVRNKIRELRKGETYTATIACLAGHWQKYGHSDIGDYGVADTSVSVSDGCKELLTSLCDDMDVATYGDVLACLVACYERERGEIDTSKPSIEFGFTSDSANA